MKGLVVAECGFEGWVGQMQAGAEPWLVLTSPLPSGRSGLGPTVPETAGTELMQPHRASFLLACIPLRLTCWH